VLELARDSDILIACIPGGKETRHIIDGAVLDALGPTGFVVNVARGSVLDTNALVAALKDGRVAGAGLDVVDGEPEVPAALLEAPNVVISPHIGARSPEASDMMFDLVVENLQAHFAGKPLLTPIPGSEGRRRAA
jgi:lactate dehydrogenase-like 2-hydroxyacid dehydrogenase